MIYNRNKLLYTCKNGMPCCVCMYLCMPVCLYNVSYVRLIFQEEIDVNAKKGATIYLEVENEMPNILTSDNRTTTEMQMV